MFFVRTLVFITPTDAHRITFDETLRFERIHEETYRSFGFDLCQSNREAIERVHAIKSVVEQLEPQR